jgi:hypothetical protein
MTGGTVTGELNLYTDQGDDDLEMGIHESFGTE